MLPFFLIEDEPQRSFMQQLYFRYRARMYAVAFSVMGHHHDSEDIVNDTLLKLIEKIPLLMGLSCFALQSYIVISTKRTAINLLRRRKRRSELLFDDESLMDTIASSDPDPDEALLREADIQLLGQALARLSQRQRDLLDMKYLLGLSDNEIAETFGVKAASLPSLYSRARRALRDILKELDHE